MTAIGCRVLILGNHVPIARIILAHPTDYCHKRIFIPEVGSDVRTFDSCRLFGNGSHLRINDYFTGLNV